MCDQEQLYERCARAFLSPCNVRRIAAELALDPKVIAAQAQQWIAPSLAMEADYHPTLVNEMFIQYIRSIEYNPLGVAMQRTAQLPDSNELRVQDLRIKQPYKYDQHAPDIAQHAKILAGIIKNNLPGNQKTRYLKAESSIFAEQHELCNYIYKNKIPQPVISERTLQPHYVQQRNHNHFIVK